jgi:hypothetical protein
MKSMGDSHVLKSGKVTAVECLRYSLSLPVSVVITGCERLEILDQASELARSFKPLNPAQKAALLAKTQEAARTGDYEPFKTTPMFDGTAQNRLGWVEHEQSWNEFPLRPIRNSASCAPAFLRGRHTSLK